MSTDIASPARYRATGKRKNAVARVILIPGTGTITCNGRPIDEFFGSKVLVTQARKPFEATGTEGRFDVVALLHGGGVSGQAGALRHGIARALTVADENAAPRPQARGLPHAGRAHQGAQEGRPQGRPQASAVLEEVAGSRPVPPLRRRGSCSVRTASAGSPIVS